MQGKGEGGNFYIDIASDERTSFVGSHFFCEVVSGRTVTEDVHELVQATKNYYVLISTPKKPELLELACYKSRIHKKTFLPVKIECFDQTGEKYRQTLQDLEGLRGRP